MSFEEMVVALVGAIGAFALVGYLAAKTFGLIKAWIDRNKSGIPEEEFDKLARAFMDHKRDTQRRIKNLEAIIAADDGDLHEESQEQSSKKQIDASKQSIEIDHTEQTSSKSTSSEQNSNLRNMLRE
ncbi:MAG: hypothetical protein ACQEST_02795 [Bacteroidota bacterium]